MIKDRSSKIKINMIHPVPDHHLKNIWDTGLMQVPFHTRANIYLHIWTRGYNWEPSAGIENM